MRTILRLHFVPGNQIAFKKTVWQLSLVKFDSLGRSIGKKEGGGDVASKERVLM